MDAVNASEFIEETEIPGLLIVKRPTFTDERGYFREVARLTDLQSAGVNFNPVQFSHSYSMPGVIRAIHTEKINKLVYALSGKMFGAYIDTRVHSATFAKVVTIEFDNSQNPCGKAIYIPQGVGNSICAVGPDPVHYVYLVDGYWSPQGAQGIAWNDPELNIKWPVDNPIISERDKNNPTMRELFSEKFK